MPITFTDKLDDYQRQARSFALYPGQQALNEEPSIKGLVYTSLGLAGETGEFCDKVKKIIRDHGSNIGPAQREQLIKELGDVLWYVSQAAFELNIDLSMVANRNLAKLEDRRGRGTLRGCGDDR